MCADARGEANPIGPAGALHAREANPRAALVADLAAHMAELAAAGDVEGARIVHETIGRLLGAKGGELAAVVDLARERGKRST